MRWVLLLGLACNACAQGISTKFISPGTPTKIVLTQESVTTIRFPEQFSGVYGLGLVSKDSKGAHGNIQCEYSQTKPILVLYALSAEVHTFMTVFMSDQLYVFELVTKGTPDIAVTLQEGQGSQ